VSDVRGVVNPGRHEGRLQPPVDAAHAARHRIAPPHPRRIVTLRGAGYLFVRRQDEDS